MSESSFELAVRQAQFPQTYEAAKRALAQCERVDECKDWSDKAAAMAVYAKQTKDKTLLNLAKRIQARAVRRYGELLREIEPHSGARTDIQPGTGTDTRLHSGARTDIQPRAGSGLRLRKQAGAEAGLSERQVKTGLRVASIPKVDFERQVDSESVPSITALAAQGTVRRESWDRFGNAAASEDSVRLMRLVDRLLEVFEKIDLTVAIDGIPQRERARFLASAERCARIMNAAVARARLSVLHDHPEVCREHEVTA